MSDRERRQTGTAAMIEADDSWQDWLARHGPALVLLARQWTASEADAEDVVQEAFIRFWHARGRVADPVAYLHACVKRCALDWQRTRRRQGAREQAAARPEAEPLFAAAGDAERRTAVESALKKLPPAQAEVLVLKVWSELTFRQIGEVLAISENTAASRYRYGLARLRELLDAACERTRDA